jgi:hypothetical protein
MLMAIAAVYLLLQCVIVRKVDSLRISACLLVLLAVIILLALLHAFPDIRAGATAGLSPNERILAANEHHDVWSMYRQSLNWVDYAAHTMPTLIALVTGIMAISATRNRRRRMLFAAYSGVTFVTGAWAQIYWRLIHHAQTAMCPLLLYAWQRLRAHFHGQHKRLAALTMFIAMGPLWMLFVPSWAEDIPLKKIVFFPAKPYMDFNSCNTRDFTNYISRHYSPNMLIAVPDWDSSAFLFETDLKIDFLANFPSNDHFIDNRRFFGGQDMGEARMIAETHGFDLVAVCGMTTEFPVQYPPNMVDRMRAGWLGQLHVLPDWLKPVYTGVKTNYLLFKVDRNVFGRKE